MAMASTSSSPETSNQLPLWMKKALINHEDELKNGPPKLMEEETRSAIWTLCNYLNVAQHGIPGQACRLYERFIYVFVHENLTNLTFKSRAELENYKRVLMSGERITLNIVSCVQLAAKMTQADSLMTATHVKEVLQNKLQYTYSVREIIDSEFEVFKTLGYQVPLWTSLDVAQMLAREANLPLKFMYVLELTMRVAEYRRPHISVIVRDYAQPMFSSTFNPHGMALATLHLIGGAIAASARIFTEECFDDEVLIGKLAELTRAPVMYIQCIRDVILTEILESYI